MNLRLSVFCTCFALLFSNQALSLTITSPEEGQIVYQRDRLTVIVKADAGEQWDEVILDILTMPYDSISQAYTQEIEIPDDTLGSIDFTVLAYNTAEQKKIKLTRNLFVKLPSNVALQGIVAGSKVVSGSTLVLLGKMPEGSSAADIESYEKAKLSVYGNYSDGVKRDLTSSSDGTTYSSSDEKVVTVSPEGKVRAQDMGSAKITVRNRNYTADVDVVVKPYK